MIIDRIREEMSVISADDRCVGFVSRLEGDDMLRITCITEGYGYDRLVPLEWVSDVDKYVFLDKTSDYVTTHWDNAPMRRSTAAAARGRLSSGAALDGALQPKAA